jgi:uncharacterized membrane protein YfcA
MEILVLCIAALLTSLLTFFSGFGLGTILTPVFAIFFPVDLAIALTGVVHFFNNVFKFFLTRKDANKEIVIRFGLPAFFSALLGAWLLLHISELPPLLTYSIGSHTFLITPVKLVISVLIILFSLMEVIPFFQHLQFGGKNNLLIGGILSGFFGGLSGNQGALRSAFLIKSGMSKESFIATGIVIACIVDISRLGVYMTRFAASGLQENLMLVITATACAFIGAYGGNLLLKKITLQTVKVMVTVMLVGLSIALGLGLV